MTAGPPYAPTRAETATIAEPAFTVSIRHEEPVKRVFDVVIAGTGLIVLSPLFIVCAALAKFQSPGTLFFRGPRIGSGGKPFRMYKFRTMVSDAPKIGTGITAANDIRITRIGRILRRTKLDEMPQLLNVLNGTMSLVGPRPELPQYVALYTPEQREVLAVRPGITGPTQIRFRDEEQILAQYDDTETYYITRLMPEKLAMDLDYIRYRTFWRDVGYLTTTIALVVKRFARLVYARRSNTTEEKTR